MKPQQVTEIVQQSEDIEQEKQREEMSLEGREYYHNHPVMKLVAEVLETSLCFSIHSPIRIEMVSEWEKTDVKNRTWYLKNRT